MLIEQLKKVALLGSEWVLYFLLVLSIVVLRNDARALLLLPQAPRGPG